MITAKEFLTAMREAQLQDRKPREDVQKKTFSPSALGWGDGRCPRRWVLLFRTAEFDDRVDWQQLAVMQNGTKTHERLQRVMENSEIDIEIEREITNEDPPIRGFVDGIILGTPEIPVEIKSARDEAYAFRKSSGSAPGYQLIQELIYMKVLGTDTGFFWYENKNDQEWLVITVRMTEENEALVNKVWDWMREVYDAYEAGKLPEDPFKRKNAKACKECPVRRVCQESEAGDIKIKALDIPK